MGNGLIKLKQELSTIYGSDTIRNAQNVPQRPAMRKLFVVILEVLILECFVVRGLGYAVKRKHSGELPSRLFSFHESFPRVSLKST